MIINIKLASLFDIVWFYHLQEQDSQSAQQQDQDWPHELYVVRFHNVGVLQNSKWTTKQKKVHK